MSKFFEFRVGWKHIYGVPTDDGKVRLFTDCSVYPDYMVEIIVTETAATELAKDRTERSACIQDLLPDTPACLREIFLSGDTPAEFDQNIGRRVKKPNKYPGYVRAPAKDLGPVQ